MAKAKVIDFTKRLLKIQAPDPTEPVLHERDVEFGAAPQELRAYWNELLASGLITAQEAEELDDPAQILKLYRQHERLSQNFDELKAAYKRPTYSFSFWRTLSIGTCLGFGIAGSLLGGGYLSQRTQLTQIPVLESQLEEARYNESMVIGKMETWRLTAQKHEETIAGLQAQMAEYQIGDGYNHDPFILPTKTLTRVSSKTEMVDYIFRVFQANGRNLSAHNNYPHSLEVTFKGLKPGSNLTQITNHLQSIEGMEVLLEGETLEATFLSTTAAAKEDENNSDQSYSRRSAPMPPLWKHDAVSAEVRRDYHQLDSRVGISRATYDGRVCSRHSRYRNRDYICIPRR